MYSTTRFFHQATLLLSIVFVSSCGTVPYTGSPMVWSLDKTGFVRNRDAVLNGQHITEADVVTLTLNTVYLKYIAEEELFNFNELGEKRQLLIYTEVFDTPESSVPFSTVIFNGEIRGENIFSPTVDRVVYGPMQFKGHPLRVKLYVVELDKKDNELGATILKSIGDAASAAQPTAAPVIGMGVQLGSMLTAFNKDDHELTADITFHPLVLDPSSGQEPIDNVKTIGVSSDDWRVKYAPQKLNSPVMPLRVGNYLLVKVESEKREKATGVSSVKEYLSADFFSDGNYVENIEFCIKGTDNIISSVCNKTCPASADCVSEIRTTESGWLLMYKSGYMWLDYGTANCVTQGDAKETCDWNVEKTSHYEEKSYAIFGIHTGGKVAVEQKVREVAIEQAAQIGGLLQTNNQELIISSINNIGQSSAASLNAKEKLNDLNKRASDIPGYRESTDFPKELITSLYGKTQRNKNKARDTYFQTYNMKLLSMIRSAVPSFPLWPETDSNNWTQIDIIKKDLKKENILCLWYSGLYKWNPDGKECKLQ